jgi:hypothetical protein
MNSGTKEMKKTVLWSKVFEAFDIIDVIRHCEAWLKSELKHALKQ